VLYERHYTLSRETTNGRKRHNSLTNGVIADDLECLHSRSPIARLFKSDFL